MDIIQLNICSRNGNVKKSIYVNTAYIKYMDITETKDKQFSLTRIKLVGKLFPIYVTESVKYISKRKILIE